MRVLPSYGSYSETLGENYNDSSTLKKLPAILFFDMIFMAFTIARYGDVVVFSRAPQPGG